MFLLLLSGLEQVTVPSTTSCPLLRDGFGGNMIVALCGP